jgi:hypothetical protein
LAHFRVPTKKRRQALRTLAEHVTSALLQKERERKKSKEQGKKQSLVAHFQHFPRLCPEFASSNLRKLHCSADARGQVLLPHLDEEAQQLQQPISRGAISRVGSPAPAAAAEAAVAQHSWHQVLSQHMW